MLWPSAFHDVMRIVCMMWFSSSAGSTFINMQPKNVCLHRRCTRVCPWVPYWHSLSKPYNGQNQHRTHGQSHVGPIPQVHIKTILAPPGYVAWEDEIILPVIAVLTMNLCSILCVYSVDHGGEIRMTEGPGRCMFKCTHLHSINCCCYCVFIASLFLCSDACDLTLDPNTAHTQLILSEENRKITRVPEHQLYPDHPERFDTWCQVICGKSLPGRCYWEAEWDGVGTEISVTYKGIRRKGGSDCRFGYSIKSWSLFCIANGFTVWHNKNKTDISVPSHPSKRVGVYVDVSAGTLSFYSISDTHTLTHLHTFNTTFTEPLYAGFRVYDSSVSLCEITQ